MPSSLDIDAITEARREAIAKSIKPISPEELRALGEELFPVHDDPWREKFSQFLEENSDCSFHHATTHDRVEMIYCAAKEKGMWYLPGSGMGPLQARGLKIMKEAVGKLR